MRILYLGNSWVGWQVLDWLKSRGEDIVGLVVHPETKAKCRQEILRAVDVDSVGVWDATGLRRPKTLEEINAVRPQIGVSVFFGYILRRGLLDLLPQGCINVHPALLPYNRGAYPNVWSIIDGTPAGVTIHYIDEGVDTGDIIAQESVPVELTATGETLYRKLELACVELFKQIWPAVRAGGHTRVPQRDLEGTHHRTRDVDAIDCIDLDQTCRAGHLVNILRARTFPPHPGVYFVHNGKKIYLRLHLVQEEDLNESG